MKHYDAAKEGEPGTRRAIPNIGHSNHPIEKFLALLKQHEVEAVADVRSIPHSRYVPQFNSAPLKRSLEAAGIRYLYLGKELGGMPSGKELYDEAGHAMYARIAVSEPFLRGIDRLIEGADKYRVAIMCSEEDPRNCHRHLLVARVLTGRSVEVRHIRGDGSVEPEKDLNRSEEPGGTHQTELEFGVRDEESWKSTRSVSPRRRPSSSPEH
jgi:uncharacterized protein (DUF488 family)